MSDIVITAIVKNFNGLKLTVTEQIAYSEIQPHFDKVKFDWKVIEAMKGSDQRKKESWDRIRQKIK